LGEALLCPGAEQPAAQGERFLLDCLSSGAGSWLADKGEVFWKKENAVNQQNSLVFWRRSGFRNAAPQGHAKCSKDAARTRVVSTTLFPPFVRLKLNIKENKKWQLT
jgi:hypothetical protein